jgi:plasmid stabilization system protein ParE
MHNPLSDFTKQALQETFDNIHHAEAVKQAQHIVNAIETACKNKSRKPTHIILHDHSHIYEENFQYLTSNGFQVYKINLWYHPHETTPNSKLVICWDVEDFERDVYSVYIQNCIKNDIVISKHEYRTL